jgi:hypothetical protein
MEVHFNAFLLILINLVAVKATNFPCFSSFYKNLLYSKVPSAMTFSITTLSITTFSLMTLSITAFSI